MIPCNDPRFTQSLPEGRQWQLVEGDLRSGQLLYRDLSGAEALVPSVWYNQPVAWRVDAMRWYAERSRECARRQRAMAFRWSAADAKTFDEQAARLDGLADEMERTGRVLA
jgi:hypothetical protein